MKTIDIVCGKEVDTTNALKTMYGDRPYYFCSQRCEMNFVSDPLKFVDKSKSVTTNPGSPVITPDGHIIPSRG